MAMRKRARGRFENRFGNMVLLRHGATPDGDYSEN